MKTFISLFLFTLTSFACTTFQIKAHSGPVIGKSYDWPLGHGYALLNKRGLKKTSLNIFVGETPTAWTSNYGSITFNQHGLEFPLSGMNEKGLVVEILWLNESVYPKVDKRTTINELQWLQYQLDNFASVPEVLLSLEKIRLRNVSAKVHYMVCDSFSECATIEFIKGKSIVHTGENLPYKGISNDTYIHSIEYLRKHAGYGGEKSINPTGMESLDRFARVIDYSKSKSTPSGAFEVLSSVKVPETFQDPTVWNLVYEPLSLVLHFSTTTISSIRSVDLKQLDYSCKSATRMLNMEDNLTGDVTNKFVLFDSDKNSQMIRKSLPGFLAGILASHMESYPESVECVK